MLHSRRWLTALLLILVPAAAPAQSGAGTNTTSGIAWQRTAADAFAVQKATGLPLLIVVNMDGEVFNDQFATQVYKDPAFIELTRGYVCVVCSPDEHVDRDYDAAGNRVECRRFPGCTCSEHKRIEPILYEKFFAGKRVAPRHIGVSADGTVLFDRFLDNSKQAAIDAIRKHRGTPKADTTALPASVAELFASRDAAARRALEERFRAADAAAKRAILEAAAAATNEPFDLLRMALRSDDEGVVLAAANALAKVAAPDSTIDVEDALARADDPATTAALAAALARIGANDPAVARLALHLGPRDRKVAAAAAFTGEWRERSFDPDDRASIEAELDRCETVLKTNAGDQETRLRLATAQAAFADVLFRDRARGVEFWLEDASRNAQQIRSAPLRADVHGLLAHLHWMQGDPAAAEAAMRVAAAERASGRRPDPWLASHALSVQLVLGTAPVLADQESAKTKDLRATIDLSLAILDVFAARGGGTEPAFVAATRLLDLAGLRREARTRLAQAVRAFPGSERLHVAWRNRLLVDLDAESMRRQYAKFVEEAKDRPTAEWFAGAAAIAAGERHTDDKRAALARAAYDEAIARFEKSRDGNADYTDSANHCIVAALAGRAHLRFGAGDAEGAVADLVRAFELRPESLDETDGLQRKPRGIAGRIEQALRDAGRPELADRLKPLRP